MYTTTIHYITLTHSYFITKYEAGISLAHIITDDIFVVLIGDLKCTDQTDSMIFILSVIAACIG